MKSLFTLLVTAMTVLVMTLVLSISSANGFLGHSQASIVMLLGVFFCHLELFLIPENWIRRINFQIQSLI
jgi:hypothetical protein